MDSLTFELTSLAPVKGKKKKKKVRSPKKRAISKTFNDTVRVNFQIVYNVLKIVKTKIVVPFIYSSFII